MRNGIGFAGTALAAIALVTLTTALPATARGPGDGMMQGMMGEGPFGDEGFALFDTDGDGRITAEELAAHRAAMVAGADANNDGKLSAEELAAQHMQRMQQRAAEQARMRVERLDTDGDGLLTVEELSVGPMPEMLFERLDADDDGAVTRAEADEARARMAEHHGQGDGPRGHRRPFWMGDDN